MIDRTPRSTERTADVTADITAVAPTADGVIAAALLLCELLRLGELPMLREMLLLYNCCNHSC